LFKKRIPTQVEITKFADVMPTTLRKNVVILLRMVVKDGYTLDKNFVEKINKRLIQRNGIQ